VKTGINLLSASRATKLIKDYEFNPESVDDFLTNFRRTIDFAELAKAEEDMNKGDTNTGQQNIPPNLPGLPLKKLDTSDRPEIVAKHYPIPLSKGKTAVIAFETLPVEKKDIDAIKKWLELFVDSLTETDEDKEG
jgi:hypothetical protein